MAEPTTLLAVFGRHSGPRPTRLPARAGSRSVQVDQFGAREPLAHPPRTIACIWSMVLVKFPVVVPALAGDTIAAGRLPKSTACLIPSTATDIQQVTYVQ